MTAQNSLYCYTNFTDVETEAPCLTCHTDPVKKARQKGLAAFCKCGNRGLEKSSNCHSPRALLNQGKNPWKHKVQAERPW